MQARTCLKIERVNNLMASKFSTLLDRAMNDINYRIIFYSIFISKNRMNHFFKVCSGTMDII